jgi:hypothetical protein
VYDKSLLFPQDNVRSKGQTAGCKYEEPVNIFYYYAKVAFNILVYFRVPQLFSPAAHPDLSNTHDGTPQNVASRKGGTKLYMTINMYLHINIRPIRIQAYENKTLHMLERTTDDEI